MLNTLLVEAALVLWDLNTVVSAPDRCITIFIHLDIISFDTLILV